MSEKKDNVRNFCIIAHIDHGKSTLADRLLEVTNTVTKREMQDQILDDMDLERERGITIKSHAIQMDYVYCGMRYILNLIDTPGHVDFSYEVSRSIASCEGALLVVDATQGVQAQTIANLYMAINHNITVIPVINKVDLPGAMIEKVSDEIVKILGCERNEIILASAKTGQGVESILEAIIKRIPCPDGDDSKPLQALVFDSIYNPYQGVEILFRIFNGKMNVGDRVKFLKTKREYDINELGVLKLKHQKCESLSAGDVGYIITGIKSAAEVSVGDTITTVVNPCTEAVAEDLASVKHMVFASIFPIDTSQFELLQEAIAKLQLNDASLTWQYEKSEALGPGFRCGFLGMLHLEVVQERLSREFGITVISTAPSVEIHVWLTKGEMVIVKSPSEMPDASLISYIEEPMVRAQIISKPEFMGEIIKLCTDKRGEFISQNFITEDSLEMFFNIPLIEIVFDFFDKLKSISHGYASLDYEPVEYRMSNMVRVDIMINHKRTDAFSAIVHRSKAVSIGRDICERLRNVIPRHMFEIAIQAAIGGEIIVRSTIKALCKDVTSKCYGGDITRKRKLLEKQKEGKKEMKRIGTVDVPKEAFLQILTKNKNTN